MANSAKFIPTVEGSVKAWINFKPVTSSTEESFGITSLIDNATGDFSHNFATLFSNTTYALNLGVASNTAANLSNIITERGTNAAGATDKLTGSDRMLTGSSASGNLLDVGQAYCHYTGTLA